jgi:pyruvate ferredoxin oxidoreductase alpha subunit
MLDPERPITIGTMVGPEAFTEVRYLAHHKQLEALKLIPALAAEFASAFGRDSGGLLKSHEAEAAETVVVAMGSVIGTMKEVFREMRSDGTSIGGLTVRSFRPFPRDELRRMLRNARRIIVFEKSLAVGLGGEFASNVRWALRGLNTRVYSIVGGLGGRPITRPALRTAFERGVRDGLEETTFLDLNREVVERELARQRSNVRSGAAALNILRDATLESAALIGRSRE